MRGKWIEQKIAPRTWRFKYVFLTRHKPKRKYSNITGNQYAIKVNKDTYRLILRGRRYKQARRLRILRGY